MYNKYTKRRKAEQDLKENYIIQRQERAREGGGGRKDQVPGARIKGKRSSMMAGVGWLSCSAYFHIFAKFFLFFGSIA